MHSIQYSDSNVIPLQLLQRWRSPFFGSFTIIPLFQSLGITSFVHISLKRSVKALHAKCMSVLSISAQMLSVPGAFPDVICCIACVTSCSVGTPVAIIGSLFGAGVSSYGNWFSDQNFWELLGPSLSLGFLCCQRIHFIVLDNAYNCLVMSAELFLQSIYYTHFSSLYSNFHFHCNIVQVSCLVVPSAFLDLLIFDTIYSNCSRRWIILDLVSRTFDLIVFLSSILFHVSVDSHVLSVLLRYPRVFFAVLQYTSLIWFNLICLFSAHKLELILYFHDKWFQYLFYC